MITVQIIRPALIRVTIVGIKGQTAADLGAGGDLGAGVESPTGGEHLVGTESPVAKEVSLRNHIGRLGKGWKHHDRICIFLPDSCGIKSMKWWPLG